ncbi:MAG: hypothetical protein ACAH27_06060 [Xanthobacteraceae bacterium]
MSCNTCRRCLAPLPEDAMTTTTHTVATDALATLGKIIDETAGRDAIHLAVEPVTAGARLYPGQEVGFIAPGIAGPSAAGLGIVDPFLVAPVQQGQKFWLIVFPRTITSLRHVWAHPHFPDLAIGDPTPAAAISERDISEAWLRRFCDGGGPSYDRLIEKLEEDDFDDESYLHFSGVDAHGNIPHIFWHHAEIVLGRSIERGGLPESFSCGC